MKIAVVDDDLTFLEDFSGALARCASGVCALSGMPYSLFPFAEASTFLRALDAPAQSPFDLVFLDILLPERSGLELAREVYARDRACGIVYVTASPDYAMQGYGVNALGYLLKPLDDARLWKVLEAWSTRKREAEESGESIWLKVRGELRRIGLASILYAESEDKRVYIRCTGEDILWQGKLNDLAGRLPASFVRVHQSYAVNLDRAVKLRSDKIVLEDGSEIPVSYRYRRDVSERFFTAVAGEL